MTGEEKYWKSKWEDAQKQIEVIEKMLVESLKPRKKCKDCGSEFIAINESDTSCVDCLAKCCEPNSQTSQECASPEP